MRTEHSQFLLSANRSLKFFCETSYKEGTFMTLRDLIRITIGVAINLAGVMILTKLYTNFLLRCEFLKSIFSKFLDLVCNLFSKLKAKHS